VFMQVREPSSVCDVDVIAVVDDYEYSVEPVDRDRDHSVAVFSLLLILVLGRNTSRTF